MPTPDYCAIDFGTSNSAVAVPHADGVRLVPLEGPRGELADRRVLRRRRWVAQLRPRGPRALRRWRRRTPHAFDQEHPRLGPHGRSDGDRRGTMRCATSTSSSPTCATCAAGPRPTPGRRRDAWSSAAPCTSTTTTRCATAARRRPSPRQRASPASATCTSSTSRSPQRSSSSRAARANISCSSPTSAVAPPTSPLCEPVHSVTRASTGATTSLPTMACTSPARTSIAP